MRKLLFLASLLITAPVLAAGTGITTKQAKTAAPVDVSATSTSNVEGRSEAFARADHNHKVSGMGFAPIGATSPSSVAYVAGLNSAGVTAGMVTCDKSLPIQASAAGNTQVISASSTARIYTCGFYVASDGPTAVKFTEGNCGGTVYDVTGAIPTLTGGGVAMGLSPFAIPLTSTSTRALCLNLSANANVGGWISYAVQP